MKELLSAFIWRFVALSKVLSSVPCHMDHYTEESRFSCPAAGEVAQESHALWAPSGNESSSGSEREAMSCSNFFCLARRVRCR